MTRHVRLKVEIDGGTFDYDPDDTETTGEQQVLELQRFVPAGEPVEKIVTGLCYEMSRRFNRTTPRQTEGVQS